ncbi:hypothetical protein [Curtobacterium sp. MCPF17_031]|uniref:hypothetical protein n=1 Tax=Curtobacterium sp. MCPF17_031 TaxID=2175653 RepID=UPI000DAAB015|nr:hypothetical protein [Curtobacterium sp. MCPF17_031]PZE33927.1 hypothetical protein DEJ31_15925 [Curtobacterium sp. MCPF17_031]
MAFGFTVTVRSVGPSTPAASWRRADIAPLLALAAEVNATKHRGDGYPFRWTFPADTFASAPAAATLGAEEPLMLRADVVVEAWDES